MTFSFCAGHEKFRRNIDQYYSALTFVSDIIIENGSNVILVILRQYFKLGLSAIKPTKRIQYVDWLVRLLVFRYLNPYWAI